MRFTVPTIALWNLCYYRDKTKVMVAYFLATITFLFTIERLQYNLVHNISNLYNEDSTPDIWNINATGSINFC